MIALAKPWVIAPVILLGTGLVLLSPVAGAVLFLLASGGCVVIWKKPRPVTLWILLLAVFFFFPYSTISPTARMTGTYFTLYRKLGGLLSVWDVILGVLLILFLLIQMNRKRLTFKGFSFPELSVLSGFVLLSFLWGVLHVSGNILGYGPTGMLRPIVSLQVFFYFLMVYFFTVNFLENRSDWAFAKKWLIRLTGLLAVYGIFRFVGILLGKIETMWPFGLPVILYDQMLMLYLPIFAWVAAKVLRKQDWKGLGWVSLMSLFFIVASARRFNYVLLLLGTLLVLLIASWLSGHFWKRLLSSLKAFSVALAVLVLGLVLIFPSTSKRIAETIQSINIYTHTQKAVTGSDIRRQEIRNLILNMDNRPYSFAIGMGLGTKWKAIVYQPIDSFSFTEKYLKKSLGWFPQFHIPYFGLIYRYGILGLLLFWGILVFLFVRFLLLIRKTGVSAETPLLIGMLVFLMIILPTFGDSANPTGFILSGFYLGLLEFRVGYWGNQNAQ